MSRRVTITGWGRNIYMSQQTQELLERLMEQLRMNQAQVVKLALGKLEGTLEKLEKEGEHEM